MPLRWRRWREQWLMEEHCPRRAGYFHSTSASTTPNCNIFMHYFIIVPMCVTYVCTVTSVLPICANPVPGVHHHHAGTSYIYIFACTYIFCESGIASVHVVQPVSVWRGNLEFLRVCVSVCVHNGSKSWWFRVLTSKAQMVPVVLSMHVHSTYISWHVRTASSSSRPACNKQSICYWGEHRCV